MVQPNVKRKSDDTRELRITKEAGVPRMPRIYKDVEKMKMRVQREDIECGGCIHSAAASGFHKMSKLVHGSIKYAV